MLSRQQGFPAKPSYSSAHPNRQLLCMLCLLYPVAWCCSDKQAIDCLKQAGWSVEGGIEVFFSSNMQGGSVLDTRAIEQLYLKYKGKPAAVCR